MIPAVRRQKQFTIVRQQADLPQCPDSQEPLLQSEGHKQQQQTKRDSDIWFLNHSCSEFWNIKPTKTDPRGIKQNCDSVSAGTV